MNASLGCIARVTGGLIGVIILLRVSLSVGFTPQRAAPFRVTPILHDFRTPNDNHTVPGLSRRDTIVGACLSVIGTSASVFVTSAIVATAAVDPQSRSSALPSGHQITAAPNVNPEQKTKSTRVTDTVVPQKRTNQTVPVKQQASGPLKQKVLNATKPSKSLAPVNLTTVLNERSINVTLMCEDLFRNPSACVAIDPKLLTKVRVDDLPFWIPRWIRPQSHAVIREIPNIEVLTAGIMAGSIVDIARTPLLYPIETVKARIQADNTVRSVKYAKWKKGIKLQRRIQIVGLTLKRRILEGNLYTGMAKTLLVSVPATGVYFGVRDVTKRFLNKALKTPSKLDDIAISITGAFAADVMSLMIRTPADAFALRKRVATPAEQEQDTEEEIVGDWFGDSLKRLPTVVATDLPYLLTKVALNGFIVHGDETIGRYELITILTACTCALLTTPFDVARTRILINSDNDQRNGRDGGSGEGVIETMKRVMAEGDGGVSNLFAGWFERTSYLGIAKAVLEPLQIIAYLAIRDFILLEWFD
jgi:hypothetical protein